MADRKGKKKNITIVTPLPPRKYNQRVGVATTEQLESVTIPGKKKHSKKATAAERKRQENLFGKHNVLKQEEKEKQLEKKATEIVERRSNSRKSVKNLNIEIDNLLNKYAPNTPQIGLSLGPSESEEANYIEKHQQLRRRIEERARLKELLNSRGVKHDFTAGPVEVLPPPPIFGPDPMSIGIMANGGVSGLSLSEIRELKAQERAIAINQRYKVIEKSSSSSSSSIDIPQYTKKLKARTINRINDLVNIEANNEGVLDIAELARNIAENIPDETFGEVNAVGYYRGVRSLLNIIYQAIKFLNPAIFRYNNQGHIERIARFLDPVMANHIDNLTSPEPDINFNNNVQQDQSQGVKLFSQSSTKNLSSLRRQPSILEQADLIRPRLNEPNAELPPTLSLEGEREDIGGLHNLIMPSLVSSSKFGPHGIPDIPNVHNVRNSPLSPGGIPRRVIDNARAFLRQPRAVAGRVGYVPILGALTLGLLSNTNVRETLGMGISQVYESLVNGANNLSDSALVELSKVLGSMMYHNGRIYDDGGDGGDDNGPEPLENNLSDINNNRVLEYIDMDRTKNNYIKAGTKLRSDVKNKKPMDIGTKTEYRAATGRIEDEPEYEQDFFTGELKPRFKKAKEYLENEYLLNLLSQRRAKELSQGVLFNFGNYREFSGPQTYNKMSKPSPFGGFIPAEGFPIQYGQGYGPTFGDIRFSEWNTKKNMRSI